MPISIQPQALVYSQMSKTPKSGTRGFIIVALSDELSYQKKFHVQVVREHNNGTQSYTVNIEGNGLYMDLNQPLDYSDAKTMAEQAMIRIFGDVVFGQIEAIDRQVFPIRSTRFSLENDAKTQPVINQEATRKLSLNETEIKLFKALMDASG